MVYHGIPIGKIYKVIMFINYMAQVDWVDTSETGNWNISSDFNNQKILKFLILLDEYLELARFGTLNISEEFLVDDKMKANIRIKSTRRFINTALFTLGNSRASLRRDDDKVKFDEYIKILKAFRKIIPSTYKEIKPMRSSKYIKINEEEHEKLLEYLETIKNEMLDPLHRAELLSKRYEDTDPKKTNNTNNY